MPDLDSLARLLIVVFSTIAALGLGWFMKREMRWYADNVKPEPPPPIVTAYRRWRERRK